MKAHLKLIVLKWQYFIDDKFHSVQNMDMRLLFPQESNSYLKQIGFNIIHNLGIFTEQEFDDNPENQIYILELKKSKGKIIKS